MLFVSGDIFEPDNTLGSSEALDLRFRAFERADDFARASALCRKLVRWQRWRPMVDHIDRLWYRLVRTQSRALPECLEAHGHLLLALRSVATLTRCPVCEPDDGRRFARVGCVACGFERAPNPLFSYVEMVRLWPGGRARVEAAWDKRYGNGMGHALWAQGCFSGPWRTIGPGFAIDGLCPVLPNPMKIGR